MSTGRGSGAANSDHLWSRSWPGASSTSRALFPFPALADGRLPGPVRQFPLGDDPVAFGPGARASPACDVMDAAIASAQRQRLVHNRLPHLIVASFLVKDLINRTGAGAKAGFRSAWWTAIWPQQRGWRGAPAAAWTPNRYAFVQPVHPGDSLRCRGQPTSVAGWPSGRVGHRPICSRRHLAPPRTASVTRRRSWEHRQQQAHFKQLYASLRLAVCAELVCDKPLRPPSVGRLGSWR